MEILFGLIFAILAIWFAVWLVVLLPYRMAIARNREGVAWVLVSLFGSPFLAIVLLLALGPK